MKPVKYTLYNKEFRNFKDRYCTESIRGSVTRQQPFMTTSVRVHRFPLR